MVSKFGEHDELYSSLGKFIVSFAEVEHWLGCLLRVLTDEEENTWITLFFIDDMMTGRIRDKIACVAKLRLENNPSLLTSLKDTLKLAQEVTSERNDIIHGQWRFDQTGRAPTTLWTFKLSKKEGRGCWEHLHQTDMTATELEKLTSKSDQLASDMERLRDEIEKSLRM
jgi:hypothetical protein